MGETEMRIYETTIQSANILRVAAGTTGLCGGDSGHGGRTRIELEDAGGTDMEFRVTDNGLVIELGGDSELSTVIEALEWAAKTLRKQMAEQPATQKG
jgi:hypothetical protein